MVKKIDNIFENIFFIRKCIFDTFLENKTYVSNVIERIKQKCEICKNFDHLLFLGSRI